MEDVLLQNFLDPIARVWASTQPSYPLNAPREQKVKRLRDKKKPLKRLPK